MHTHTHTPHYNHATHTHTHWIAHIHVCMHTCTCTHTWKKKSHKSPHAVTCFCDIITCNRTMGVNFEYRHDIDIVAIMLHNYVIFGIIGNSWNQALFLEKNRELLHFQECQQGGPPTIEKTAFPVFSAWGNFWISCTFRAQNHVVQGRISWICRKSCPVQAVLHGPVP